MSEVRVGLGTADRGIALPRARAREDAPQRTRSAQPFRVAGYGRVDTAAPLSFTFDGKPVRAFVGDTVASALLAEGTHLVGRSFKYHRPRGIVSAGSEEPNALIGVIRGPGREEPNTRATLQEVFDGLASVSQNRWPSLGLDVGAVNDALSPILTAGFYYKTFLWPRGFWTKVYEPLIRSAAGLGRAPRDADPDRYASRYAHCDVLVVGAGAAGLSAALAAGRSGARVILADEQAEMGGSLLAETSALIDGAPAWDFLTATLAELSRMDNVRLLPRTTAIAYQHDNMVALAQRLTDHLGEPPAGAPRERLWRVRAREVVLAQGAVERPLVFDGNDRPGVMLASAGRVYLNRYGVAVGRRVVVATAHDSAWGAAFDLVSAGIEVAAIADARETVSEALVEKARRVGIEPLVGHVPTGTAGRRRVRSVRLMPRRGGASRTVECDALLVSGGWTPSVHLFSHTKAPLGWEGEEGAFLPGKPTEACQVVGAGRAGWELDTALDDGARAGAEAARRAGFDGAASAANVTGELFGHGEAFGALATDRPAKRAFVDYQNDVTAKDIRQAVSEGFRSIEHVKRYTTTGMATDQGKLSNINTLVIAAEALNATPPEVGLTTFRPPYTPTTFGTFANLRQGQNFEVVRRTAIDPWAEANGAVFEPVALWRRARYFPRAGEGMDEAVTRECVATRGSLGMFDASTLGKIEVVGPDAAEFLNRMYTNPLLKLGVGRCRYALLLGEDGFIRDDGVIGRLAEDRFHVTTTTGGAPRVLNTMEDYLQTEWPELRVWLTSVTEQWATVALQGPNARRVVESVTDGLDLSEEAFPHMSVAQTRVAGIPARLFRISFTGELGFEVNVPARQGRAVWERLHEAGRPYDVTPYGTEAMHVLRAEKGYIVVGQDTDGTVTPQDAGLGWAIGKKKSDFVGMRGLARPDLVASGRRQLVGLRVEGDARVLEEGAQVVADRDAKVPATMIGHVTSAYHSATLGRPIAMALVENGFERMGQTLYVPMADRTIAVEVTGTVPYDPDGARLKPS